jgi:methylase of polypeptide subunit release factors
LGKVEKTLEHPRFFDTIVGNPPYTRHLEIEDIQEKAEGYKEKLIQKALIGPDGRKFADISKRAGIYAYFFIHGTKFLQNSGRFGFIVSNSWLDADYGKGLSPRSSVGSRMPMSTPVL